MIIVGVLLLVVGYSVPASPPPGVIGGWLLLVIGLVLAVMGRTGRGVGGRNHYY